MGARWGVVLSVVVAAVWAGTSGAATPPAPVAAPAIDWSALGQQAPTPIAIGARAPTDPLPKADVVILTWTTLEWSALDHVFLNSATSRSPSDRTFEAAWPSYTRNTSPYTGSSIGGALWGSFQLVQISDAAGTPWRVLLFKSNAHVPFQPYIAGLRAMLQNILTDASPRRLYSIGTAGGARLDQRLGDVVVTNAATLQASLPQNVNDPANGQTFTSPWQPTLTLAQSSTKLMVPLGTAATSQDLQSLFTTVFGTSSGVAASDVITADFMQLDVPAVHALLGVPLNTSDDFLTTPGAGLAPGDGQDPYSAYETDDAVVAQAAVAANVEYASIRNVSDPVVPSTTASGGTISPTLRTNWGTAVYDRYGFLTAVNGAVATWATLAGDPGTGASGGGDGGAGSTGDGPDGGGTSTGGSGGGGGGGAGGCAFGRTGPAAPPLVLLVVLLALVVAGARRRAR